ncbi:MAG: Kynurenine formamidase [Bacteroidetes bacterium ADurb.Bin408]|nr:MAG: Kynurenine formamidase [Bacteroidetes bacterium ADurb.Bin408]
MPGNKYILLSHVLNGHTPSYGDRDKLKIDEVSSINLGATANSSIWHFSSNHLGTHIDVPRHFFPNGPTVTDYPLSFWSSTKVQLIEKMTNHADLLDASLLKNISDCCPEVLLIRTGYEKYRNSERYWNDNPGISCELAVAIRETCPSVRIIGFDFISLTSWKHREEGKNAHRILLKPDLKGNSVCIIEDMSLKNTGKAISEIFIIPLFVQDANGSPVTVLAATNKKKNQL